MIDIKDIENKIINADCMDILKQLPDKCIDMILCDLPYGTTLNKWDCCINLESLWKEYDRITKETACIALFAQTPFDKVLGCSNIKNLRYEWIWEKEQGTGFLNSDMSPLKKHENILIFYKKTPTYNPQKTKGTPYTCKAGQQKNKTYDVYHMKETTTINNGDRLPVDIIKFSRDKNKIHPTQKPVALCEYLIKTYTNENDLVLDNCSGSGTTAIACMHTNRRFICIEKDKDYWEASCTRLEDEQRQGMLF